MPNKRLPWFKFNVNEWLSGNITLENEFYQGLFINICAYYWKRSCNVTYNNLMKKYKHLKESDINYLFDIKVINRKNNVIVISFLDEQWKERIKLSKRNSTNGKKGAIQRWKEDNNSCETPKKENGECYGESMAVAIDKNGECYGEKIANAKDKNSERMAILDIDKDIDKEYINTMSKKFDKIENLCSYCIFSYWLECGLLKHRKLKTELKKKIILAIKKYGVTHIKNAIKNYSTIIRNNDKYWFSYKWNMDEFFRQGTKKTPPLEMFSDERCPLVQYSRNNITEKQTHQVPKPVNGADTGLF